MTEPSVVSQDKTKRTAPRHKWTRNLSQDEPSRSVHTFSRPPMMEALSLLPVAMRVGSYISQERKKKREPIFDLNVSRSPLCDCVYVVWIVMYYCFLYRESC